MTTPPIRILAQQLLERTQGRARAIVAIAGPPGAGKSTMAEELARALGTFEPLGSCAVVALDGFHYDNALLTERGAQNRKGAPDTFDCAGFRAILDRIRGGEAEVAVPVFDRSLDLARAGARLVQTRHRMVLVEGNYLLLEQPPWNALRPYFDCSLFLDAPDGCLRRCLVRRWMDHGFRARDALRRARSNDMVNVAVVRALSGPSDLLVSREGS